MINFSVEESSKSLAIFVVLFQLPLNIIKYRLCYPCTSKSFGLPHCKGGSDQQIDFFTGFLTTNGFILV